MAGVIGIMQRGLGILKVVNASFWGGIFNNRSFQMENFRQKIVWIFLGIII